MFQALMAPREVGAVPRSIGSALISTKCCDGLSRIDSLRTSGATKIAFPHRIGSVHAIVLNTAGGLTGGDRFETSARAGPDSHLVLTTQAAERAYRSQSGAARVGTRLSAAKGSTLHWLPQELIVFDGAFLERQLEVDVVDGAEAVLVEPVVFGRLAAGEITLSGVFRDRITLRRDGRLIFWDSINLAGDISVHLDRPAVAQGMTALASAVYFGPRAEALLHPIRRILPQTGGASLLASDLLAVRLLAPDSFMLRQTLIPVLECLTNTTLPKSWSL